MLGNVGKIGSEVIYWMEALKVLPPFLIGLKKKNNTGTLRKKIIYTTAWVFNVYPGYEENIPGREG